jgi:hypothetical protein
MKAKTTLKKLIKETVEEVLKEEQSNSDLDSLVKSVLKFKEGLKRNALDIHVIEAFTKTLKDKLDKIVSEHDVDESFADTALLADTVQKQTSDLSRNLVYLIRGINKIKDGQK